ncbi:MAG TPA: malate synthase G, partial [Pseudorhizobium sp.]|nr:malate synthase G [Pseudorhizobium sp.]
MARIDKNGIAIDEKLYDFLVKEAIPGTGVDAERFFSQVAQLIHDLAPKNRALLAKRDEMQEKLDEWYRRNGAPVDLAAYESFLREIGYLVPEGPNFQISTDKVDPEIAAIAGPQLVVPVMNARYALNAANARWGSLYDALYGTDAIAEDAGAEKSGAYNPARGAKVIAWVREFLDSSAPLSGASWSDVTSLVVAAGRLTAAGPEGRTVELADPSQFAGYVGEASEPTSVILRRNGLHIDIRIDSTTAIGKDDAAKISDVRLESAITTIMDCEDSVAAVDADDKVLVYRNWLGLMKGDLQEEVSKEGRTFVRKLEPDLSYETPNGDSATLKGRS